MRIVGAEAVQTIKPRIVADNSLMRLNIGCGKNKLESHINVDREPQCHPDFVYDVEQTPWPWKDATISEVNMNHVLEHLGQDPKVFCAIVCEVHRVLRIGGLWNIVVPHPRSEGFISDPTHVRPITENMLSMWSKKICQETIAKGWANTPFAIYHDVDFEIIRQEHKLLEPWWTRLVKARETNNMAEIETINFARDHYWNVIGEIVVTLQKVGVKYV